MSDARAGAGLGDCSFSECAGKPELGFGPLPVGRIANETRRTALTQALDKRASRGSPYKRIRGQTLIDVAAHQPPFLALPCTVRSSLAED